MFLDGIYDLIERKLISDGKTVLLDQNLQAKLALTKYFSYEMSLPSLQNLNLKEDLVSCRYKTFGQDFKWGTATASY